MDRSNNGLDGVIPRQVLEDAKGFAIYSVVKAGFVLSARAGSGIVIARLPDGNWSAPSAIGTAGMGIGTQAGAELTDVLIVLNSTAAARSFMSAGSITLGTNLSVAVGPLGRNGEASGSISTDGKVSATYSYSKTRGLFGGVSLEGSVIVERQDANALAYGDPVSAKQLLSGAVDVPQWAMGLIRTLELCTSLPGGHKWVNDAPNSVSGEYVFGGIPSPSEERLDFLGGQKRSTSWAPHRKSPSLFSYVPPTGQLKDKSRRSLSENFDQHTIPELRQQDEPFFDFGESFVSSDRSPSVLIDDTVQGEVVYKPPQLKYKRNLTAPLAPGELGRVIALYNFTAREPGDLTFMKGDVITIILKSDSMSDWWTGRLNGKQGIFPANFVEEV